MLSLWSDIHTFTAACDVDVIRFLSRATEYIFKLKNRGDKQFVVLQNHRIYFVGKIVIFNSTVS